MNELFVPISTAELEWREGYPFSKQFNDIYFSEPYGLEEKEHVFIQGNNLIKRWQSLNSKSSFTIAETGFGTGLNFLLAWSRWLKYAPKTARLHFFSCEQFPLSPLDLQRSLALWPSLQPLAAMLIAAYPVLTPSFHYLSFAEGRINLILMLGEAVDCFQELVHCGDSKLEPELRTTAVDAWFLDGFTPSKNPRMWREQLFYNIQLLSKKECTLTTYSAAAMVKKNLQDRGFEVHKKKGFGLKRNMIFALFKNEKVPLPYRAIRTTPWQINGSAFAAKEKKALVIGAGLAGCYTAYALAKRGWQVTILEGLAEAGTGASANTQAILYPKITAYRSPLTVFMLTAFLYAQRVYAAILKQHSLGELSGILQLAFDAKEAASQAKAEQWLAAYPALGLLVNEQQASTLAGLPLHHKALFIRGSGWINSQALCQFLLTSATINLQSLTEVKRLIYQNAQWQIGSHSAEVVVLANGFEANQFTQTAFLPLKTIRGQMTAIASTKFSKKLKIPLCGEKHLLPENNFSHAMGATYHSGVNDTGLRAADDEENLAGLSNLIGDLERPYDIVAGWAGVRGATSDYLPAVGPVPNEAQFNARFASLATDAKRWIGMPGIYHPGLYLCAGFGSRGLTTIPLCAEWLAATINGEPSFITRSMERSLAPARFLIKKIIK